MIKKKNRKDYTNCIVKKNRRDPVICKVTKTSKPNISKCVPKEVNPNLKTLNNSHGPNLEPTPVEPTPVEPTPVEPTPVEPTPVEPTPVEPTPAEPTRSDTCFEPMSDPTSGQMYYVEKKSDGSYTEKTQWDKPEDNQLCTTKSETVEPTPVEPTPVEPTPVEPTRSDTCFEPIPDPTSGQMYYVEKKSDGSYTEKTQWDKPEDNQLCTTKSETVEPTPVEPTPVEPTPVEPTPVEPTRSDTCFEPIPDPTSGQMYYVEKKSDGSYTEKNAMG